MCHSPPIITHVIMFIIHTLILLALNVFIVSPIPLLILFHTLVVRINWNSNIQTSLLIVCPLTSDLWSVSGVSGSWESDWWPREVLASYIESRRLLTLVAFSETCFGHHALTTHYSTFENWHTCFGEMWIIYVMWNVSYLTFKCKVQRCVIRFEPFSLFLPI